MPDINDIQKSATMTDRWLLKRQKKHVSMIEASVVTLQNSIIDQLTKLNINKSGKIEGIRLNLKNAVAIQKQIEILFGTQYSSDTKKIIDDFKNVNLLITNSYKNLDEAVKFTGIDLDAMTVLRDGAWRDYLAIGDVKKEIIIQSVYDNVIGGGKFSDLVVSIEGALLGVKSVTGRPLIGYGKLYANDFIMNYHNEVNIMKAESIDINDYLYIGDIIKTTRQFCRTRAGKTYTKNQINSWTYKWAGKSGPAFTHRGGYNCRHHWQPVRKEWLGGKSKIDIQDWNLEQVKRG